MTSPSHSLTQYHNGTFFFLPSAENPLKSALFHYETHAWLLHLKRNDQEDFDKLASVLDRSTRTESFHNGIEKKIRDRVLQKRQGQLLKYGQFLPQ